MNFYLPLFFLLVVSPFCFSQGIKQSERYPQYWTYQGDEIMLLGGSVEDNLFQIDSLEQHLDLLVACGGNYVRNTMSSRDPGNVWPFYQQENGIYDLDKFNEEYWRRFRLFLEATKARDIIVQIEIWATFDFYREPWAINPFNPRNNKNYNAERSKLPTEVPTHPVFTENNFFRSVPSQMHLTPVLWYQKKFVDQLLSYSLQYDHVIYCMDNETSVTSDWGKFWANYIRKQAFLEGKDVETTEMWDPHNLDHPAHFETFDHPEIFSFVDISQNNHLGGDDHWNNGIRQIEYLQKMDLLRPVNNVKVYGNDGGRHQTTRNAIESFCRNVLFGSAGVRFHRPTSGQGLNEIARKVISGMRQVSQVEGFFSGRPDNSILIDRQPGEAYARVLPKGYLIYFPEGGEIRLKDDRNLKLIWLDLLKGILMDPSEYRVEEGNLFVIKPPAPGHFVAWLMQIEE